jgi:hypothetical protein
VLRLLAAAFAQVEQQDAITLASSATLSMTPEPGRRRQPSAGRWLRLNGTAF